ncbi:MAG: alpha/beta fold hydrolase [Hyphomicrobiaceae bacterium]
MTAEAGDKEMRTLSGMGIEVERLGQGRPLLLLQGEEALEAESDVVAKLASDFEVIIPSYPGFGASERPLWITRPHDIAFILLDLVEQLELKNTAVIGFSLGGWIAAEMATIDDGFMSRLVLVDPYGVKLGGPTDRDIADIWMQRPERVLSQKWHDQDKSRRDFKSMPDEKLAVIARNIETTARFCWEPYMHNPKLKHRLHRIHVPTLFVWGEHDGIVKADPYGKGYASLVPGATLTIIPDAGHLPHLEQPEAFLKTVTDFIS